MPRKELIEDCMINLLEDDLGFGHYFTMWAPRQTGKTWLMREVKKEIEKRYSDKFTVGMMSRQRDMERMLELNRYCWYCF